MPLLLRPMRENQATPVLPAVIKKAFGHLRRFVMFHMSGNQQYEDMTELLLKAVAAHQELLAYGAMAEQVSKPRDEDRQFSMCHMYECIGRLHSQCCFFKVKASNELN